MTILEEIDSIINSWTGLQQFYRELNISNEDESKKYRLDEIGTEPLVKMYVNGDSINQFEFMFTTSDYYDKDSIRKLQNSDFNRNLIDYLDKNIKVNLFKEDRSREVLKLLVTSDGEVKESIDVTKARYEIKFKLVYFKGEK